MCTVCRKIYGRYNSVSYHVTIYHRNPPIRCDLPGCQFTTREARYIHFHKYYRHGIPLPQSIDQGMPIHHRANQWCVLFRNSSMPTLSSRFQVTCDARETHQETSAQSVSLCLFFTYSSALNSCCLLRKKVSCLLVRKKYIHDQREEQADGLMTAGGHLEQSLW